jgi:serine protease Do
MRRWQLPFFSRPGQVVFWVLVIALAWVLFASDLTSRWWWPFERPAPRYVTSPSSWSPSASPRTESPPGSWTAVAKSSMPAVVNIATSRMVRGRESGVSQPFFLDPFFPGPFGPPGGQRREHGLGSGTIVTPDGYVLTNNHVVEGAQDIRVTLADRREFRAKLVGGDPKTDIAVLKLTGSRFPVMPLGDSNRVVVAEVVLAIGNPFGLDQTVTMGIVSAVGRANLGISDYEDFIQTDAAINPGNSGGALVNARGELIGTNTAIFSQSGGYMGIGFAVPINMARQVMDQLVTRGRVTRGYLGVSVQELTPAAARALGLPTDRGVLVGDVAADGPAARGGLKQGDVITAINGTPVDDVGRFRNLVSSMKPGTRVTLTVLRDGREQTVEVPAGELADRTRTASAPRGGGPDPLGLAVAEVTPDLTRRLGLPPDTQGALVAEVAPGGLVADAGLRPGDVIQQVNRQPVRSARDFTRAVEQAAGKDLLILVNRGGSTAYLVIERGAA